MLESRDLEQIAMLLEKSTEKINEEIYGMKKIIRCKMIFRIYSSL